MKKIKLSVSILDNSKIDPKTISKDKKIKNGVDKFILSVSENGYGKRSSYLDYRVTNRGGKGIYRDNQFTEKWKYILIFSC